VVLFVVVWWCVVEIETSRQGERVEIECDEQAEEVAQQLGAVEPCGVLLLDRWTKREQQCLWQARGRAI
jgi:hypothetical protein